MGAVKANVYPATAQRSQMRLIAQDIAKDASAGVSVHGSVLRQGNKTG